MTHFIFLYNVASLEVGNMFTVQSSQRGDVPFQVANKPIVHKLEARHRSELPIHGQGVERAMVKAHLELPFLDTADSDGTCLIAWQLPLA